MSYNFTPLSDEELDSFDLISEGIFNFEVRKSERKVSRSGNPMCALTLKVWDQEGKEHIVYDYLVFSSVKLNIRKVSHFCKAVGLEKDYMEGNIPECLDGHTGKVSIGIEDQQINPNGGFYPKKNIVLDYVKSDNANVNPVVNDFKDDEFPF